MSHVDYRYWADYILQILAFLYRKDSATEKKDILELACGTGRTASHLVSKGFNVIATDRSLPMLMKASKRLGPGSVACFDMRSPALNRRFDAVLCLYDSLNYVLKESELLAMFRRIREQLVPGGVFITDIATQFNITRHFDGHIFSEHIGNYKASRRSYYDPQTMLFTTQFDFKTDREQFSETHVQKIYEAKTILDLAQQAGFGPVHEWDGFSFKHPGQKSERVNFACMSPSH